MRCQVLAVLGLVGAAAAKPCSPVYPSGVTVSQTNSAASAVTSSSASAAASDTASGSASGSVSADASASASASASGYASDSASASGSVSADASASSAADVSSILSSVVISSTVSVSEDASYTVSSDAASSTGSAAASDYSSGAPSSDASSISVAASTDVSSAASSDASSAASSDASSAASYDTSSTAAASSDGSSVSVAASTDVSSSAAASTDGPSSVVPSTTAASSTEVASSSSASPSSSAAVTAESVDSTVLIIARDEEGASSGASGLIAYGIQYQKLIVPQEGATLPTLNTGGKGNYAAIIIVDAVSYQYADGWRSAITTEQWDTIHKYQTDFHVRMVRINEFPGPAFGATIDGAGGCCEAGVEQLISFSDVSDFPTANLKTGEGITSQGLYHYPSVITDTATTKAVAKFAAGGPQTGETVAAVINNFSGREQFVWFTSWAPTWSATSNYLQHAHIHWMTRGVFLGKRKVHLSAQIDDVQLETELFFPAGEIFKINTADLEGHIEWQKDINSRLPAGSDFWLELAHNGNGDIEAATTPDGSGGVCNPDYAVWYDEAPDTPLEFQKPLGTGVDQWPSEFQTYGWSDSCAQRDPFAVWFQTPANLNAFAHLSHTFTHLALNNATYKDAEREIQFNQAWFKQMGIDQAERWSQHGLVPPAITGLHNGDVINAWLTNGIKNVVGDNTRPVLRSTESQYWPLISTVEGNGFAGLTIVPRYATTIYFNCDTAECTTREWIQTSGGSGDFQNLLAQAKSENSRYLFGLHADPYMFHQANMRQNDQPSITVGSQTGKFSIVSAWVEIVSQEVTRLTNWPITSLKHDDIAKYFTDRMALDKCKPTLSLGYGADGKSITSVTVGAEGNTCSVPVPVTIPSGSVSGGSVVADQVGSEPPIQWVTLSGSPVTLSLGSAVTVA